MNPYRDCLRAMLAMGKRGEAARPGRGRLAPILFALQRELDADLAAAEASEPEKLVSVEYAAERLGMRKNSMYKRARPVGNGVGVRTPDGGVAVRLAWLVEEELRRAARRRLG